MPACVVDLAGVLFRACPRGLPAASRPSENGRTGASLRYVYVFDWLKVFATLIAAFGLLFILLDRLDLADTVRIIAVPLLLYGIVDTADGLLGLSSKVDRLTNVVRIGPAARPGAVGKLVLGLVTTVIGLIGLFSAVSVQPISG